MAAFSVIDLWRGPRGNYAWPARAYTHPQRHFSRREGARGITAPSHRLGRSGRRRAPFLSPRRRPLPPRPPPRPARPLRRRAEALGSKLTKLEEHAAHANFVYDDVVGGQVITRVCLDFMEKRDGGGGGGFSPDWFESYLSLDATWE